MNRRTALGARVLATATRAEARAYGLRERRVDAGDTTLAVLEGGPADAPAVVLLHGYTADRVVWMRFAKHLVRDHRVVVPELAGHGASGFTSGTGFSAPAQADRVAAVMDALGIKRAHVAGNSMGGFVAATLAVAHPERVASLLLSDAVGVASPEPSEAALLIEQGMNPFFLDDVADFPAFYALTMARPPYVPGFVRAAIATDYVARRDDYEEIFTDLFDVATLDERLGEITAPTLVMWGEQDRLVHPSTAQVWADGIAGARIVRYPDAGHMPMLELPGRTASDYRSFLSRVTADTVTSGR
ncbi:alpha/beta fold hydrolase [Nocardioides zhouii]|uniref:Alpha/beta fold hydrolase n=1 Tax=Nocardioides zhouii TaxID=1168729 RepID=A0A4Q2T0J1_9ACTN|nr:alpha/beta fold hydrolase [Nocardioides zhouii]RYC10400.1 alpha/beta fold hydrolase [Nocardioides zhouii]